MKIFICIASTFFVLGCTKGYYKNFLRDLNLASTELPSADGNLSEKNNSPIFKVSQVAEEFIGPLPSWGNVKNYGATGDGITDDTAAIQRALDDTNVFSTNVDNWQVEKAGSPSIMFFPAGTYRITRTLKLKNNIGVGLVGQHPSSTKIFWDGVVGGTMLLANGVFGGRFARITWDGKSNAGIGIAHWWNKKESAQYGGSPEHVDEVFMDLGVGIVGGCCGQSSTSASHPETNWSQSDYGDLDSEGTVKRTKFIRNSVAGLSVESYNALDWWVIDSEFIDCYRGLTNVLGAGNILAYRNLFQRSKYADIHIGNTQWHSMHFNVSVGSRRFLESELAGDNGAPLVLKNNRIINTTDPSSIFIGQLGPLLLFDNEILSAATSIGPVVSQNNYDTSDGRDVVAIGNKFTLANQVLLPNPIKDRLLSLENKVVASASISTVLPTLPSTPTNQNRQVFEVPLKINATTLLNETTAAMIQQVIDSAVASSDPNPVVHFPRASYDVGSTLIVPANRRIQLVGDGFSTKLKKGTSLGMKPLLRLKGPSLATVRDFTFYSDDYSLNSIAIDKADQDGGRILLVGTMMGDVAINDLALTRIEAQTNSMIKSLNANAASSILSVGAGNIGPTFVGNNSHIMLTDTWWEGVKSDTLVQGNSGSYTYLGGNIAPPTYNLQGEAKGPTILLDQFAGQFTLIGLSFDMNTADRGILINREVPETKAFFLAVRGNLPEPFYKRTGSGGVIDFILAKVNRIVQVPNTTAPADKSMLESLTKARSLSWDRLPASIVPGSTDVLLYRIRAIETAKALQINGK